MLQWDAFVTHHLNKMPTDHSPLVHLLNIAEEYLYSLGGSPNMQRGNIDHGWLPDTSQYMCMSGGSRGAWRQ